ncbi:hypothetical protein [Cyclobacterium plantarum]|uniref:hypothetical protein n=1 Tax=Cyclobacterium plantarum TaxID=2716263 RepID=UPI003F6F14BC
MKKEENSFCPVNSHKPSGRGKAPKLLGYIQFHVRWSEHQTFPEKGYYTEQNQLTTYYN